MTADQPALATTDYEGTAGDTSHITRVQRGQIPLEVTGPARRAGRTARRAPHPRRCGVGRLR